MKAQYAILRFAKYKGPEIGHIESHNERTKEKYVSNPDVDTARSHRNFHLVTPQRKYRAEAEKQIAEAGCRTRSDSVRARSSSRARRKLKSKPIFRRRWALSKSIKTRKRSYPPWCIWTRKRPICTFVLSR